MTSDTGARPSSGLSILWDVIVAPRSAFAALRETPYAGWAFLITCIVGVGGALLQMSAGEHVAVATFATNASHDPRIASMTPAQQQSSIALAKTIQQWVWVFYPVIVAIGIFVASLILLVFNALGRGDGNFRKALALAANVAILTFGINYFLTGVLIFMRGPDAFSTSTDLLEAMPSLAWLAPGAGVKLVTFLAGFTPFTIWSFVLLALGQRSVFRTAPIWAWIGAAILAFTPALMGAAAAR